MKLELLGQELAVVRYEAGDPIPEWVWASTFFSITRTSDELSVFCDASVVPEVEAGAGGWRAIRVVGTIDLSVCGIISALTFPLASKQISVFSISTHDTDYLVVPQERLDDATDVLRRAGHQFV